MLITLRNPDEPKILCVFLLVGLLIGSAYSAKANNDFVDIAILPFAEVLNRLAVLETKEAKSNERINALEEEILNLKQKAAEDYQLIENLNLKIDDLNLKIKPSNFQCEGGVKQQNNTENENDNTGLDDDVHVADSSSEADEDQLFTKPDGFQNRHRRMETENQVAFFATVSPHDVYHLGSNQAIVFDNAVLNIGSGYHPHSGVFSAPLDGIYSFTATVFGGLSSGNIYFAIIKNNVAYARFETKSIYGRHQVTQTVILQLSKGDDVAIRHVGVDHDIIGANFTTFSGFLLYEKFPQQQVVVG